MRRALLALLVLSLPLAAAGHDVGTPRSLGGVTVPQELPTLVRLEAEDFAEKPVGAAVQDAGATGSTAWRMPVYGLLSTPIDVPETGVVWVMVRARGEHPAGTMIPHMHPVVDGEQRGEWDVGATWLTYRQSIPMEAGRHVLSVDNFNNYHADAEDRTLFVDWVEVSVPTTQGAPVVSAAQVARVDGPEVHMAGTGMARLDDVGANGNTSWHMWGIGCFVEAVVAEDAGAYELWARLRGNAPGGVGSRTTILVDGAQVGALDAGDAWVETRAPLRMSAGAHVLEICYDNDYGGKEKRNLWLDELTITAVDVTSAPPTEPTPVTSSPVGGSPPASPILLPTPTATPPSPTPSPQESAAIPSPAWVALAAVALALGSLQRRR